MSKLICWFTHWEKNLFYNLSFKIYAVRRPSQGPQGVLTGSYRNDIVAQCKYSQKVLTWSSGSPHKVLKECHNITMQVKSKVLIGSLRSAYRVLKESLQGPKRIP